MKKGCKIAITIVGVALVVVLLRGCVATSYLIPSSGMENSLYQSERILVNKWSYGLRLPFMKLWGVSSLGGQSGAERGYSCIQQSCQSFRTRD